MRALKGLASKVWAFCLISISLFMLIVFWMFFLNVNTAWCCWKEKSD